MPNSKPTKIITGKIEITNSIKKDRKEKNIYLKRIIIKSDTKIK